MIDSQKWTGVPKENDFFSRNTFMQFDMLLVQDYVYMSLFSSALSKLTKLKLLVSLH
jgi:hypothetical protein